MTTQLDPSVEKARRSLAEARIPEPEVLFLMATGTGLFPEQLSSAVEHPLGEVAGVPPPWAESLLVAGRLGRLAAWVLEDVSGEPRDARAEPAWMRAFPVWLAAACGASVCVHTSAGCSLPATDGGRLEAVPVGGFAVLHDHINFSGETPLSGLGESRLGPLFPDLSMLHHLGLRRAVLEGAERLGFPACEAVGACTQGPSLETPAERRMLAAAGADVAVQSLGFPLLAAAHAGLAALSIVCITDSGDGPTDVASLIELAGESSPALEDLLVALGDDLERAVGALAPEVHP